MQFRQLFRDGSVEGKTQTLSLMLAVSISAYQIYQPSTALAESPVAIAEIEQLYAAHKYPEALSLVNAQMRQGPTAELYYLEANIMAAQGKLSLAYVHYQLALGNRPSTTIRTYCENAMAAIRTPQTSAASTSPPVGTIEQQALQEANSLQSESSSASKQVQSETSAYLQNHATRTNRITNDMASQGSYLRDGEFVPAYDPSTIAAVRARREAKEARVADQGRRTSEDIQSFGEERAAAVVNSAQGLESQMHAPARSDDAVLNPAGTNLFVRNYAESKPEKLGAPTPATVTAP